MQKGSFGHVYLVQNESNEKFVVKESLYQIDSQEVQNIFFQEIFSYLKIKHPAILPIIGFNMMNFNNDNFPIIISEYMVNGSLRRFLNKYSRIISEKKFDEVNDDGISSTNFYIILIGIAIGMKYVHSKMIIHRDIKPENILLDENYYPKISDFGCAKIIDSNFTDYYTQSQVGTPLYMAPEIVLDDQYNYKVDIYSFSLIAYELITGNRPFTECKNILDIKNTLNNNIRPDVKIIEDKSIQIFLNLCWANNESFRPTFEEIVDEILDIKYLKLFNADEIKVNEYLSQFDEKFVIKKTDSSLPPIKKAKIILHEEEKIVSIKKKENISPLKVEFIKKDSIDDKDSMNKKDFDKNSKKERPKCKSQMLNIKPTKPNVDKKRKPSPRRIQIMKEIHVHEPTEEGEKSPKRKLQCKSQLMTTKDQNIQQKQQPILNMLLPNKDSSKIVKTSDINFSKYSINFKRMTTPAFNDIIYHYLKFKKADNISDADIVMYDGIFTNEKYIDIEPSKRLNKIPNLVYLCQKPHFFKSLHVIREKYPYFYDGFIPNTFIIPDDFDEFKNKFNESTDIQWITFYKTIDALAANEHIQLITNPLNDDLQTQNGIIQNIISPFLIDSYKFELRMYAVISDLDPLTIFFYNEGIANFCAEPYETPNLYNQKKYIFNAKFLPHNKDFKYYRRASTVIDIISKTNPNILKRIKEIIVLSIFSIYSEMKEYVNKACESNDSNFILSKNKISPYKRFIQLIGIDIQIDNNGNPFIIGLKDNPGLKSKDDEEKEIKEQLIKSQLTLMVSLIENPNQDVENWERIFSSDSLLFKPKLKPKPPSTKKENNLSPRKIINKCIEKKSDLVLIDFIKGHEFEGIFNYLSLKTGGNIHDNGTIEVTTDSLFIPCHPKNLFDKNPHKYFNATSGKKNFWICFDFKENLVEVSHYSIKSFDFRSSHIKNWVIEISNDAKNWEKIDEQINCEDLNCPLASKTFKVLPNHLVRFFRFHHNGEFCGNGKNCYPGFCNIELYGKLKTKFI